MHLIFLYVRLGPLIRCLEHATNNWPMGYFCLNCTFKSGDLRKKQQLRIYSVSSRVAVAFTLVHGKLVWARVGCRGRSSSIQFLFLSRFPEILQVICDVLLWIRPNRVDFCSLFGIYLFVFFLSMGPDSWAGGQWWLWTGMAAVSHCEEHSVRDCSYSPSVSPLQWLSVAFSHSRRSSWISRVESPALNVWITDLVECSWICAAVLGTFYPLIAFFLSFTDVKPNIIWRPSVPRLNNASKCYSFTFNLHLIMCFFDDINCH